MWLALFVLIFHVEAEAGFNVVGMTAEGTIARCVGGAFVECLENHIRQQQQQNGDNGRRKGSSVRLCAAVPR